MNGVTEQAAKVASSITESLKSTPVVLALVVFNVLFMFLMTYAALKSSDRWDHEIERWAELVKSCQSSKTP
jgi:predicted PurR-regulated permease PerM